MEHNLYYEGVRKQTDFKKMQFFKDTHLEINMKEEIRR